ncbi:hypothetical protein HK104_004930 [Borealophlyctis nickersoniae]|nr:hypothetical protein HK104_004930 [Borealophlyctis nickersoniae]
MLALHSRPRFLVNGTKGTFLKTGWDPQESQLKQGMLPTDGKFGVDDQSQGGELWVLDEQGSTPPGGAVSAKHSKVSIDRGRYDLLFENVAQAIRAHDSRALEVTAEQAATVIAIIEAAKVSSAEKRTVRLEPFH